MGLLGEAAALRAHGAEVSRVYLGATLVWQGDSSNSGFGIALFGTSPFGGGDPGSVGTGYGTSSYGTSPYGE